MHDSPVSPIPPSLCLCLSLDGMSSIGRCYERSLPRKMALSLWLCSSLAFSPRGNHFPLTARVELSTCAAVFWVVTACQGPVIGAVKDSQIGHAFMSHASRGQSLHHLGLCLGGNAGLMNYSDPSRLGGQILPCVCRIIDEWCF